MASPREVDVYTDGSCIGNPGTGGWAFVVVEREETDRQSGSAPDTTNQRMELIAALKALRSLEDGVSVNLFTDSKYLCDGMRSWITNWKRNGWTRPRLGPPQNLDLWKQLDEQNQRMNVAWHWLKAHNGNFYNEVVDQIAQKEARNLVSQGEELE